MSTLPSPDPDPARPADAASVTDFRSFLEQRVACEIPNGTAWARWCFHESRSVSSPGVPLARDRSLRCSCGNKCANLDDDPGVCGACLASGCQEAAQSVDLLVEDGETVVIENRVLHLRANLRVQD